MAMTSRTIEVMITIQELLRVLVTTTGEREEDCDRLALTVFLTDFDAVDFRAVVFLAALGAALRRVDTLATVFLALVFLAFAGDFFAAVLALLLGALAADLEEEVFLAAIIMLSNTQKTYTFNLTQPELIGKRVD